MKFTCARIFSDNMVLQRGQAVPVHGSGKPGASVTVELNGAKVQGTVNADGKWLMMLPAMDVRGALTLKAECEGETIEFKNVVLGEVWLAGGQSNMEFEMFKAKGGFEDSANSFDPDLRYYQVEMVESNETRHILKRPCPDGWVIAGPDVTQEFSAVAYYFARKLRENLGDIPVGIVGNSWGGTSASCWLSEEKLRADPDFAVYFKDYEQQCEGRTQEEYLKAKAEYAAIVDAYEAKLTKLRETYKVEEEWRANYKQLEVNYPWPPPMGDRCFMRPCGLYETMIKYPAPYGVRGAIWYQGEGDASQTLAPMYAKLLKNVMDQWKEDYMSPDMYVGVVQLTSYGTDEEDAWGIVRTQQEKMAVEDGRGAFCVTYDVGEPDNIHPIEKRTVGYRLADQILVKAYGKDIDAAYAEIDEVKAENGAITLKVTRPLVANDDAKGFQVLADGKWSWAAAKADVDSITICAEKAEAVRYAYTTWTDANVYQKNGIPLKPFLKKI